MMHEFVMPCFNYFGVDCVKDIGALVKKNKLKKALIVTDANLVTLKIIDPIIQSLEIHHIEYYVFSDVNPNPTKDNVLCGINSYKEHQCDFIIGIGGGSPNDCAKAIGLMINNPGNLEDYIGLNKSTYPSPKLFMVNTTAGTASEISRAFLITDEEKQEKLIFKDNHTLPFVTFNDPSLMKDLPKNITAYTGMDALTHALESYISNGRYGLTQEFSLSAVKLIFKFLEKAYHEGDNIEYREQMIYAQTLAGMSFCNSGLGLVHAMAHQLGGVYNLPHGLCNAILLPYVMEFNETVAYKQFATISKELFPYEVKDKTVKECSHFLINKVKELSHNIGTDIQLEHLGVQLEDLTLLAKKTLSDGNIVRNPIQPSEQDIINIFNHAY